MPPMRPASSTSQGHMAHTIGGTARLGMTMPGAVSVVDTGRVVAGNVLFATTTTVGWRALVVGLAMGSVEGVCVVARVGQPVALVAIGCGVVWRYADGDG